MSAERIWRRLLDAIAVLVACVFAARGHKDDAVILLLAVCVLVLMDIRDVLSDQLAALARGLQTTPSATESAETGGGHG